MICWTATHGHFVVHMDIKKIQKKSYLNYAKKGSNFETACNECYYDVQTGFLFNAEDKCSAPLVTAQSNEATEDLN